MVRRKITSISSSPIFIKIIIDSLGWRRRRSVMSAPTDGSRELHLSVGEERRDPMKEGNDSCQREREW